MFTKPLSEYLKPELYQSASPFPHICFDDLIDPTKLDIILAEIEQASKKEELWGSFSAGVKLASFQWQAIGPTTANLYEVLNSDDFIGFLRELSGIKNLERDTDPSYEGGGISQIKAGGTLKIHADFNFHKKIQKYRRMNLLLYLNKDWKEEYGGSLELWNREMTSCEAKFIPHFNKCVIFNTDDYSYHGHLDPIKAPNNQTRKAISCYYYSDDKAENMAAEFHSTLYQQPKS